MLFIYLFKINFTYVRMCLVYFMACARMVFMWSSLVCSVCAGCQFFSCLFFEDVKHIGSYCKTFSRSKLRIRQGSRWSGGDIQLEPYDPGGWLTLLYLKPERTLIRIRRTSLTFRNRWCEIQQSHNTDNRLPPPFEKLLRTPILWIILTPTKTKALRIVIFLFLIVRQMQ